MEGGPDCFHGIWLHFLKNLFKISLGPSLYNYRNQACYEKIVQIVHTSQYTYAKSPHWSSPGTTFPSQRDIDIECNRQSTPSLMFGHLHDTFGDWVGTSGVNIGDLVLRRGRGAAVKAMFDNKTKAECLGCLGSVGST